MRVITTTVLLLCSTITLAQNTFYTKGLKVEECYDEEQVLFNELSENENYLSYHQNYRYV
jgi:low affinity Fe/Cu permease